jgi:hypothetical protein
MILELYQNGGLLSSVVLNLTKNLGYSAAVIPGLSHNYKLVNNTKKTAL